MNSWKDRYGYPFYYVWVPVLLFVAAFVLLVFSVLPARAQHTHEGAVGKFYKNWMMPDNRNVSCCHDQDCSSTESKTENGKLYAKRDGHWLEVPASKIERERDPPDAGAHLCARPSGIGTYTVFCYIAAAGG